MKASKSPSLSSVPRESMGLEARASKEDHLSLRLWLRLLSCSTEIETEIRRRLRAQFGISLARFDYLAQLHRHPQGLTMRAISRYLMVTGGNVTGLTDELQGEGMVTRETVPHDRRSTLIRMTPQGRRAFEQIAVVHEGWVVELFGGLKAAEREQLNEMLGRLRTQLAISLERHDDAEAGARTTGPTRASARPATAAAAPRRRANGAAPGGTGKPAAKPATKRSTR